MKNRRCKFKNCKNIVLFDIQKYCDNNFCFKHNDSQLHRKIEKLERGFFELKNYDFIFPKKEFCFSVSYLNNMIYTTEKIIFYRKKLFQKTNKRNRKGFFSYRCLNIIFAYTYLLNILLNFREYLSKGTILNDGIKLPIIKIDIHSNYLKHDTNFYLRGNLLNTPIQTFDYDIINTFESLEDFHSELHIVPYEKDILKIKKNLEKYYLDLFEKNYKYELSNISLDSINIIKNYYNNNLVYDDHFNQVYLRKKILNNQFLRNVIILTDRLNTKVYFFHK
jgi:hypothetical protein